MEYKSIKVGGEVFDRSLLAEKPMIIANDVNDNMCNGNIDEIYIDFRSSLSLILCDVPETASQAFESIVTYFQETPKTRDCLSDIHISRFVFWLSDRLVVLRALQAVNLVINQKKYYFNVFIGERILEKMRLIIQGEVDDDTLSVSFQVLGSIVRRDYSLRNMANDALLFEGIDKFCHQGAYFPYYASFLQYSLSQRNYPPYFYLSFVKSIIFLLTHYDSDIILCGINCINYIMENDSNCIEFFSIDTIHTCLINALENEVFKVRIQSIHCLACILRISNGILVKELSNNVINVLIGTLLHNIPDEDFFGEFIFNILDYIEVFCLNCEGNIAPITSLVSSLNFPLIFEMGKFHIKNKAISSVRTYSQYSTAEIIINTIGETTSLIILDFLDADNHNSAYNIMRYIIDIIEKVPIEVGFQTFFQKIIESTFIESLIILEHSEDPDTSRTASILLEKIMD